MKKFILLPQNSLLFATTAALLLGCAIAVLSMDKVQIALSINAIHSPFLDVFFKYITYLGSFSLIGPVLVGLVFMRFRFALIAAASSLIGLILVQIMKRMIWVDSPRPKVFFKDLPDIHYVEGVHLHSAHSFPSGHTAGAFALFFALALFAKKPFYKIVFLTLGILVAYSRMYLSQHFLVDVAAGALLGIVSSIAAYCWFYSPKWMALKGLDGALWKRN